MNLEFQKEVLQFLTQNRNAKKYINILEDNAFDQPELLVTFGVLKGFVTKYSTLPSYASLLEYFYVQLKENNEVLDKNTEDLIINTVKESFLPFQGNGDFIRDQLIGKYQNRLLKEFVTSKMLDIKNGSPEVIADFHKEISKIKRLESNEEEESNRGRLALAEFKKGQRSIVTETPTYLKTLNSMTSVGGFYSPQLIIIMGGPKSFKTGVSLNLAMNFVRDGYKVYYVDCENGEDRILDRFYQAMLEADWNEYNSGELDDTLEEMVQRFKMRGGDFRSDYYPANTKTMADIEDNLVYLEEELNWKPDIIIYDYLDLMNPEDYTIKEKRLKIQAVYHDAIRLQKRRGIFGMSPSQVNKDAVNKPIIDMTGFAEDFGKAANAHGAFAICRTPYEKEAKVGRIVPVIQRDGVAQSSSTACFVHIDEARMVVKEITRDEWHERAEKSKIEMDFKDETGNARPRGNKRRPKKEIKNLEDV